MLNYKIDMTKRVLSKSNPKDDEWIRKNFEQLVDKYPGRYVVVANGEVFIGRDAAALERKARQKHPRTIPSGMPIPSPEDFTCAL